MPEKACRIELEGPVARLRISGGVQLSRRDLLGAVRRQLEQLAAKDAVRGVLVCGQDARFCEVAAADPLTPPDAARLSAFGQDVLFALEGLGKPVVAALSGEITGLGLELALACSFIIADHGARFGFPEISQGRLPAFGGTQRLARLVGRSVAKQLLFSGELIDAEEALRVRLVNRLYGPAELEHGAMDLLQRVCTRSPLALRVGCEVVDAGYAIDLKTACLLERDAFALCFASRDQKEGMGSFLEKREPQFTGD
jgi:enoyl-CoA hydratase